MWKNSMVFPKIPPSGQIGSGHELLLALPHSSWLMTCFVVVGQDQIQPEKWSAGDSIRAASRGSSFQFNTSSMLFFSMQSRDSATDVRGERTWNVGSC